MAWAYGALVSVLAAWQTWETLGTKIALALVGTAATLGACQQIYARAVRPLMMVLRKVDTIYEAVRGLPNWQADMEVRMADGAAHFDRLDAEIAAWASADRVRLSAKLDELQDPRGRA